jgi:uncharacterized RDD family membrane protein YckC
MDEFQGQDQKKAPNGTKEGNSKLGASFLAKPGISRAAPDGDSKSTSTEERRFADLVLARLGDRLIAIALDSALMLGFLAVVGMYSASKWGGITQEGFSLEGKPALISLAAVLVAGFAYHWLLEGLAGATLGKFIMGLRVVGPSGKPCGLKPSLLRNLLRLVDGLGFYLIGLLVAIFSKKRQRLGDHLGKTVVAEYPTSTVLKAVAVLLWILGVGSGAWFSYSIHREAALSGTPVPVAKGTSAEDKKQHVGPESGQLQGASLAQSAQEFSVINLELSEGKGKAQRPDAFFESGKKLYASFQVVGFSTDPKGTAKLSFDVVALDPEGLPLYENWRPKFEGSPGSPGEVIPASMEMDIPVFAPSGLYKLLIRVKDELKGVETQLMKEFSVKSAQAAIPKGLEIRDFAFSSSEDGPPIPKAQVQGGQRLYMAFKVAGLVFKDDRPALLVDMQVLDPEGDLVLNQPGIVELRDPLVYHPPTFFARVTSWVDFPDEIPKGIYTAKFLVKDENSGKSLIQEAKFEVK